MTEGRSKEQTSVETDRLVLRRFQDSDAVRLAALAGRRRVADTMISVPHPYDVDHAQRDISRYADEYRLRTGIHFAVALKTDPGEFVGYVALKHIDSEHSEGELSFWIDESVIGKGFATEAGRALVDIGFRIEKLNRICAYHMVRNDASGRVLRRLGMEREGRLRERVCKWGRFEDVFVYAALRPRE